MDSSARTPDILKAAKNIMPPITPRTLQEALRLKSIEEAEELIKSTKDRKQLMELIQKKNPEAYARAFGGKDSKEAMKEIDNIYETFKSKESWLKRAGKFLWRNKGKIVVGTALVGAGVAAWYYWPQVAAWAVGAGETVRQWVRGWLGIPELPGKPEIPGMPETPKIPGAGEGLPIAPPPREVLPGSSALPVEAPGLEKALEKLK